MSAQVGVGILTNSRFSDCLSDWIPLESLVCTLKLKVLGQSLCLLKVYAPNATSEYQAFVYTVNDALLRVSHNESTTVLIIGVARIFDRGGPKPQIPYINVYRNFERGIFCGGKDIVEWKIRSRSLVLAYN